MNGSKRYPLRAVYVSPSKADRDAFRQHVAGHGELSRVFRFEVRYFAEFRVLHKWLKQKSPGDRDQIDFIFIDPDAVGDSVNALDGAMAWLEALGFERSRIIALPDADRHDRLWAALKNSLGEEQVFDKNDTFTEGGQRPFTNRLEEVMATRSDSGSETLQYSLVRLEAKLEVLEGRLKNLEVNRLDDQAEIDERLDVLTEEIRVISQTLFQGPGTQQTPAITTELIDLKRFAAGLDKDIGTLAEVTKTRLNKLVSDIGDLQSAQDKRLERQEEFRQERQLKRIDYLWRIGLVIFGVAVAAVLEVFSPGNLRDLLETLLNALSGG